MIYLRYEISRDGRYFLSMTKYEAEAFHEMSTFLFDQLWIRDPSQIVV